MYKKPMILANEELAEGIYAASGSTCYTCSASITQRPEGGRQNYVIRVNGRHNASDGHTSSSQTLVLVFNQAVTYVSSNGSYVSGNGTNTLTINYSYWNNAYDNIGLGDVYVTSADGLSNPSATLIDNCA